MFGRFIQVTDSTISVNEVAPDETYAQNVWLSEQPTGNVTVAVTVGNTSVVTVDKTSLTFTPSNYSNKQVVTITAVDDDVANNPKRQTTVKLTAMGGGYDQVCRTISVTLNDNDSISRTVDEGGVFEWNIKGTIAQDCPLTLSFESSDPSVLAYDPPSMTWTNETSGTRQLLTVRALENDTPGDVYATLFLRVSLPAGCVTISAPHIAFLVRDNDQPRLQESQRPLEIGPPAITLWTDRLAYRPDQAIRVYLDIDPHGDEREHTLFFYRESVATGERLYLAPALGSMALRDEVVDQYGRTQLHRRASAIQRVEDELIWEGSVPHAGLWHFVAELRSWDTTQVRQRAYAKFLVAKAGSHLLNRRGFERLIESDLRLTSEEFYYLGDRLLVKSGATLTIEPGTVVLARGPAAKIVIEPGARILALGRREAPVVLTCSAPLGERSPGCWGGLRVVGRAAGRPSATAPPDTASNDGAANPHDSSGVLRYVRVEFAGGGSVAGAPAAALELDGVGEATVLDHVQVHASLGDGFLFRGGTAHCGHCAASEARHASLAWDRGWRGSVQHLYVQQGAQAAAALHGRADGAAGGNAGPTFYNATLVGGYNIRVPGGAPGSQRSIGPGILLDEEAAVTARNVLATGFAGFAIDGSTASFASGRSSFSHGVLAGSGYRYGGSSQVPGRFGPYVKYTSEDPALFNVRYAANPDPRPRSGSVALRLGTAAVPPHAARFSPAAHFVGAFRTRNWLEEWTFFGPESDYEAPLD